MRMVLVVAALSLAMAAPAAGAPALAASGCPLFPAGNVWHADVSHLPVHPRSGAYLAAMGTGAGLHADFGSGTWDGGPIGIPYTVVPAGQARVPVRFGYAAESDRGPYPIPPDAPVEGGQGADGDRHVLVVQAGSCRLYELFDAHREGAGWRAGSGAVWNLRSNRLRPAGWTSADAAGLPILAGLVRYEEVARGRIDHAIRVTVNRSQASSLWPARHHAGQADPSLPPMGLRLRLKAGVDLSGFSYQARVILAAMRAHGLVVADNGSSGFIGGVPDERWDNDALHQLGRVTLADFEAVDTAPLRVSASSAAFRGAPRAAPASRGAPAPGAAQPRRGAPDRDPPGSGAPEREGNPVAEQGSPVVHNPPGTAGLTAASGDGAKDSPGLLPQALAAVLGLVAASLAYRQVVRQARRHQPPGGRHARTGTPPDPDRASSRRR